MDNSASSDPTISYLKQSDRYFLVKSLSLLISQFQGGFIYENVYERKESPLCLWLSEP